MDILDCFPPGPAHTGYLQRHGMVTSVAGSTIRVHLSLPKGHIDATLEQAHFGNRRLVLGQRFFYHDYGTGGETRRIVITHLCGYPPIDYDRRERAGYSFNDHRVIATMIEYVGHSVLLRPHPSNGLGDAPIVFSLHELPELRRPRPIVWVYIRRLGRDQWYQLLHAC